MIQKNQFQLLIQRNEPIILDGGLATQLEAQGEVLNSVLWSAELLLNNPQAIIDAHLAYLYAGAQIITTASYQASIQGFVATGLTELKSKELIISSIELAKKAISIYQASCKMPQQPLIAASVGPYGAYLADGSEYRGDYRISDQTLSNFHSQQLKVLDHSEADILALETIPSYPEANVYAQLLDAVQTPTWLSFSCRDGQHINDGTKIEQVIGLFKNHPNVLALGVNCTAPQYVSELINRIKQTADNKIIVVYPNSGEIYNAKNKTWQSLTNPVDFAAIAECWNNQGAQIIGGCCRIGPKQIEQAAARIKIQT